MANKPQSPAKVAHNRRMNIFTRRGYASLVLRLCVITLAVWIIFSQVFLITQCEGMGMFPAIEDGDLVLAYRLHEEYQKGDVVVYTVDGKDYIGRIIAKETDYLEMDDSGTLKVNGTTQAGEIMYPTYDKGGIEYPYMVLEGQMFILGDYRTQTLDSRDFGPVPLNNIKGKVITIVRRRGV